MIAQGKLNMKRTFLKRFLLVLGVIILISWLPIRQALLAPGLRPGYVQVEGDVVEVRSRFRGQWLPPGKNAIVRFKAANDSFDIECDADFVVRQVGDHVPVTFKTGEPHMADVGDGKDGLRFFLAALLLSGIAVPALALRM
jgi:hypothetical protein